MNSSGSVTQPTHPQPPALPAQGTQLPPDRTQAIVNAFRSWSSETGAQLLDLDALLAPLPDEAHQDHTLAFVIWQATDAAITAAQELPLGTADQRLAPLRNPIVGTDGSQLAQNAVEAGAIISALIDSTQSRIDTNEGRLAATAGVAADLALAAPLVKSLSMNAALHRQLLDQSVDPVLTANHSALAALVRDAAALRIDLESADKERSQLLAGHKVDHQQIEALRTLESEARKLAADAAEKVVNITPRGIVSVDALGTPPDLSSMADAPWPAVRNLLSERATKLQRAETSLRQVISSSQSALAERNELRQMVDAFRAKAMASRIGEVPDVNAAYQAARQLLWTAPSDLTAARTAVTTYQKVVSDYTVSAKKASTSQPEVHR